MNLSSPYALLLSVTAAVLIPTSGLAQNTGSLDTSGKLRIHGERVYSPWSLAGTAAYASLRHARNQPAEWGQGGGAFGKRLGSAFGYSAIHETLAFGLDSSLHQDPRYFRSNSSGILRRTVHALRGTIMTRTDSGRETLSVWRIGSAYGAAYLSNQWYPDRLNTGGECAKQGSLQLVYDLAANLASEFWPDVKKKLRHRKP